MNNNKMPAFPAFPIMDKNGLTAQFITPFPGLSKFEYLAMMFYCHRHNPAQAEKLKHTFIKHGDDSVPYNPLLASFYDAANFLEKLEQMDQPETTLLHEPK